MICRAEILEHVELFQCICEYRLKAEFTFVRLIVTLRHPERVEPAIKLLVAAAVFYCPLHLCGPTQTGFSRVSRHIRRARYDTQDGVRTASLHGP
jgi:hypothetical protein